MPEQMNFTEENKKTVISFIAGLVIGGLLVYIFALPTSDTKVKTSDSNKESGLVTDESKNQEKDESKKDEDMATRTPVTSTSAATVIREGSVTVEDQSVGSRVELSDVTFPADAGWIGVRDYQNGQLTGLLGVSRWNAIEGLYPTDIKLLRSTEAGHTYAVVFYQDNGDKVFNLATDAQIQTDIATFVVR